MISATIGDSREEIKPNLDHNPPNKTNNIHQIGANLSHDPRSINEKKEREPMRREEKKEKRNIYIYREREREREREAWVRW